MNNELNPRFGERKQRIYSKCLTCKINIEGFKYRPNKFCSLKCYHENKEIKKGYTSGIKNIKLSEFKRTQIPRVLMQCIICEQQFKVKRKRAETAKYCSNNCKIIHQKKENHPTWKGGKSFEIYGEEFDNELKEKIRQMFNNICQECFKHQDNFESKLSVHHIDYNKRNNNKENLIPLCLSCHAKTNWNRNSWKEHYQDRRLYDI